MHISKDSHAHLIFLFVQPSDQSLTSSSGDLSVTTTPNSVSLLSTSYPPSKSGEALLHSHLKRGSSQDISLHSHSNHSTVMSRTDTEVQCRFKNILHHSCIVCAALPKYIHAYIPYFIKLTLRPQFILYPCSFSY